MRTRPFGRCGFEVSELALGTWGLSGDGYGPVHEQEVDRVIGQALDLGITLFETADVYGSGAMERKLGTRLRGAKRARIVTKIGTDREDYPPRKRFDPDSLAAALERSGDRLDRDPIDVVLLHCPSETTLQVGEAPEWLAEQKRSGRVTAWGVSAGSGAVAALAIDAGAEVLELAYNPFVAAETHALADRLAEAEIAVLARSVLAHGLLSGHWRPGQLFVEGDHRQQRWTKEGLRYRLAQLHALRALTDDQVPNLRAVALRFALANGLVSSAVLGPRTVAQLDELVTLAGDGPPYLSDDALTELPTRLAAVGIEV